MTENSSNSSTDDNSEKSVNGSSPPPSEGASDEGTPEIAELDPLDVARAEAAQMKDKLVRTAADFDNYRKRSRREVTDAEKRGREGLLSDLLPVFDNLERATSHAQATGGIQDVAGVKGLIDGINLVVRQFRDALSRIGIERVESVGRPFDPSLHEAIQHLETTEFAPGHVCAEVQPGYRDTERLIRPAMVVVAKAPTTPEPLTTDSATSVAGASPTGEIAPAGGFSTTEPSEPTSTSDGESSESSDKGSAGA